jgi:hypothetical protein
VRRHGEWGGCGKQAQASGGRRTAQALARGAWLEHYVAAHEDAVGLVEGAAEVRERAALVQDVQHDDEVVLVPGDQPVDQVAPHKPAPPRDQDAPLPLGAKRRPVLILLVVCLTREAYAAEAGAAAQREDRHRTGPEPVLALRVGSRRSAPRPHSAAAERGGRCVHGRRARPPRRAAAPDACGLDHHHKHKQRGVGMPTHAAARAHRIRPAPPHAAHGGRFVRDVHTECRGK